MNRKVNPVAWYRVNPRPTSARRTAVQSRGWRVSRFYVGEQGEAVRTFQKALALEPESHRHHADLGWACLEAGRLAEAGEHLERSLAMNPDDPVTRIER